LGAKKGKGEEKAALHDKVVVVEEVAVVAFQDLQTLQILNLVLMITWP